MSSEAVAVIPARYGSSRFPGKALALIGGVPMIIRVLRRARKIREAVEVIVATDDPRIKRVVEEDGGRAVMTDSSHQSGTSRVSEAARDLDYDIVVNIQGDEPLLPVGGVDKLINLMKKDRSVSMSTLASLSEDGEGLENPDTVKVVFDLNGSALYFSRAPLSFSPGVFYRHIGIYAFRKEFLLRFNRLPRGPLEKIESLEQLRALENGCRMKVITCDYNALGVDRPEDVKRVEKMIDKI